MCTFFFLKNYFIVQVQLSAFPPSFPTPPQPSPPPSSNSTPTPLGFVHVSFIVVPENPFPLSPHYLFHLPSGYCQIVLNFNVSGYILFAFFFC